MEIEPGNWRLDVFLLFIQTWCIKITKKPTSSIYEEVSVFSLHVKSLRAWLKEGMIRRRLEGKVLHASLSHVALWCHDTHPTPSQIPSAPSKTIQKYKFPMHGRQRAQWAFVQRPWSRGWFFFFFFEALLKAITIGVESTHDNWFAGSKWETTTNSVGGGAGKRRREKKKKKKRKKKTQPGLAPSDSDKFHQSSSVKICLILAVARSRVGPHHSPIIWQQNIRGEQRARFS